MTELACRLRKYNDSASYSIQGHHEVKKKTIAIIEKLNDKVFYDNLYFSVYMYLLLSKEFFKLSKSFK